MFSAALAGPINNMTDSPWRRLPSQVSSVAREVGVEAASAARPTARRGRPWKDLTGTSTCSRPL